MYRLEPVVFHDAWGSHVSIASLRGHTIPSAEPESELWVGAHEAGPSGLAGEPGRTLADVVAADPEGTLGADAARFGQRLPFLLKILAPGKAISIQAHPTREQARSERERSGDAVYGDAWAKPELLLAIAPFEVFVGLRPWTQIEDVVAHVGGTRFAALLERSRRHPNPVHALLSAVLDTPAEEVSALVRQVVAGCIRREAVGDELGAAAAAIVRIAEEHPDDIGLAVLPLMNHRTLQPGEFIDVAAGVLHTYVHGLGIEVLANSDNVVRAGLTGKEVNVPELLRIVDPDADGIAGRPRQFRAGVELFDSASDRFRLFRIMAGDGPVVVPGTGRPRLVFCLRGEVEVSAGGGPAETLRDVEAVFVPAAHGDVTVHGPGEVYAVTTPPAPAHRV